LPARDILYEGQSLAYSGQTKVYPAVIDTGSSFLAVPADEFLSLKDRWKNSVKLDCPDTFC
jgi:hypothetical protein